MKKAEIILGAISIISLILNLFLVPGTEEIYVFSSLFLSAFYLYFSFALFNGVKYRQLMKKIAYKGIGIMRVLSAVTTSSAISMIILGVLFNYQIWSGGNELAFLGIVILSLILVISVIKYFTSKAAFYIVTIKRAVIYLCFAVLTLTLPKFTLLEFKYRNHPDYIEAFKNVINDGTDNKELREKLKEERRKIDE